MSIDRKLFKGGTVIGLTQVTGQLCSLGRNVIVARMVSPADFGIAAIFMMVVSFMAMISNLSLDRLLVQAPDGDDDTFQRVAQFLQSMRGITSCIILLALAAPFSKIFSIPEAISAFYILALIPLINGFCHLDPRRMERYLRFWPYASVELASQVAGLILAWPIAKWFGNYWAMLYLLMVKTIIMLVGSYIVAERKYRWSRAPHYMHRFFTFGWPLVINGLLMFAILQGDRFFMGAAKKLFHVGYDMADVGVYSAAFTITMIPTLISVRICSMVFFPILSKEQNSSYAFCNKARLFSQCMTFMAVAVVVSLILLGDKLLPIIYGKQYSSTGTLVAWLSILWGIRLIRTVPSTIAMALNNTKIIMYTNSIRLFSLTGVVFIVYNGMDVVWIAIIGAIGELIAYMSSLLFIKKLLYIPLSISSRSIALLTLCILVSMILQDSFSEQVVGFQWIFLVVLTLVILMFITICFLPDLRKGFGSLSAFRNKIKF